MEYETTDRIFIDTQYDVNFIRLNNIRWIVYLYESKDGAIYEEYDTDSMDSDIDDIDYDNEGNYCCGYTENAYQVPSWEYVQSNHILDLTPPKTDEYNPIWHRHSLHTFEQIDKFINKCLTDTPKSPQCLLIVGPNFQHWLFCFTT